MVTREHMVSMCDRYLAAVETRDAEQVLALFSDHPTVEDPIGSEPRVGRDAVWGFYGRTGSATTVDLRRMGPVCVVDNHAAFLFRLEIVRDGERNVFASTDVMTFDDDGRIAHMVAYPDHDADPDGHVSS